MNNTLKKLIIVGAGGFAREVAWLVEEINQSKPSWDLLGFFDENENDCSQMNGYTIIKKSEFDKHLDAFIVIAIGDPETRKKVAMRYVGKYRFATLIHPSISIHKTSCVGPGSIVCKDTIITTNVNIGNHVIVNLDCTIGHDATLKDYVTIFPSVNVSGYVLIDECSSVGTGSQIIQQLKIGANTTIGAGSVVVKDIPSMVVAVGVPARVIKQRGESHE